MVFFLGGGAINLLDDEFKKNVPRLRLLRAVFMRGGQGSEEKITINSNNIYLKLTTFSIKPIKQIVNFISFLDF